MYYLQSRYYDPQIARFINADAIVSSGQGFLGYNMFAYCRNHPVDRIDTAGYTDEKVLDDGTVDMDPTDDQPQGGGATGGGSCEGGISSSSTGRYTSSLLTGAGTISSSGTNRSRHDIPQKAWDVLNYLKNNFWHPMQNYKGGREYSNDGRDGCVLLPDTGYTYYEFDVN